jgi:hypothetical protein
MVEIVTDPNILKEIEKKTLSEKLNIEGGEIVTDPKIIDQVIKKNEQKNVKDEDSFYDKYITGEARTQFPNIPEIGSMNILKEDGTNDITKNALAAVALQLTPSTEAQIDIIKKITPGTIVSKDIYDNPILTFPKKYGGGTFYLNKPGLSEQDLTQGISQILQYIPGMGLVQRKVGGGIIRKASFMGLAGGITSATQDIGAMALGSEQGIEKEKAAVATVAGIVGEPVGKFLTRFVFKPAKTFLEKGIDKIIPSKYSASQFNIFSGSGQYLDSKGAITNKTKEIALKSGIDPKLMKKKTMIEFAQALEDGIEPSLAKEIVGANQFGISLWKAQALEDKIALKTIQDMRNGAFGQEGIELIARQDAIQAKQSLNFLQNFRQQLIRNPELREEGLTSPLGSSRGFDENISNLNQMIKDLESKIQNEVNKKYAAIDFDLNFKPPVMKNFTRNIKNVLEDPTDGIGAIPDSSFAPNANKILTSLDKFAKNYTIKNKKVNNMTIKALETERKRINNIISLTKDPTDRKALLTIKKEYDNFYNTTIEKSLANGDKEVLDSIIAARKQVQTYSEMFNPNDVLKKGGKIKDQGGAFLQNVIKGEYTPTEIANWIYGTASINKPFTAKSVQVIRRLEKLFPKGTEGYDLLRDGAFQRIINNSFKTNTSNKQVFNPELFVKNVNDAINGKGKEISNILFTDAEKKELLEFSKVLAKTITPDDLKNPSKTAATMFNLFQSSFRALLGITGFNVAGLQGTLASRFVFDATAKQMQNNALRKKLMEQIDVKALNNYIGLTGELVREFEQRSILKDVKKDRPSTEKVLELLNIK